MPNEMMKLLDKLIKKEQVNKADEDSKKEVLSVTHITIKFRVEIRFHKADTWDVVCMYSNGNVSLDNNNTQHYNWEVALKVFEKVVKEHPTQNARLIGVSYDGESVVFKQYEPIITHVLEKYNIRRKKWELYSRHLNIEDAMSVFVRKAETAPDLTLRVLEVLPNE
jgi:hypothetical protein